MMGTAATARRAAARIAAKQTAAVLAPAPPITVGEKGLRGAIGVLVKRRYANAQTSEHAAIAKELSTEL